ncbi:MAG: hypothetical protein QOE33_3485, partial [Acidobacteriota bacterium]|nr:hypothetical protein [Acidobacteriota bacterium]
MATSEAGLPDVQVPEASPDGDRLGSGQAR